MSKKEIDATPHPDTISKVGEYGNYYDHQTSGRKGLPFAIAEKIDNSISATSGNSAEQGRKIDLYFLYDERDKLVHFAVKDNGTGMDFAALQAYATYNLSQDARKKDMDGGRSKVPLALERGEVPGDDPRWTINGNIGHFGVGGQHAAFCIGKIEHVMTKVRQPGKHKVPKPVLDFTMSTEDMLEKRKQGKNCWKFDVDERQCGNTSTLSKEIESHPRLRKFVEEEKQGGIESSFTLMVVSLINDKVGPLLQPTGSDEAKYREKLQPLLEELARVYHYYLHGKDGTRDLPEVLDEDEESDGSDDSDSDEDESQRPPGKRKKPDTRSAPKPPPPKKGTPAKRDNSASSHAQRKDVKVEIVVHAIKQQGNDSKEMFSCNLIEVPSVEVKLFKAQKSCLPVFLKINPDEGKKESVASMFLYYCPYLLDKETRPRDEYDRTEGPLFSCYWQGRWVPYAEITNLTIFDKLGADKALLKRVRGTIFFDRQIVPSNSKLQFHQSVQDMMNNDAQCHRYKDWKSMVVEKQADQTRAVHTAIKDWISKAHTEFDREIRVDEVYEVIDKPGGKSGEKASKFKKMIYSEQEYVVGAKMYFKSSKPYRFGKVEYFLCDGAHPIKEDDKEPPPTFAASTATIYYKRYPLELYGEDLFHEPVSEKLLQEVDDLWWDGRVGKITLELPSEIVVLKHKAGQEYCKTSGKGKFKIDMSKDIVKSNKLENDFKDGIITAGYELPAVSVFVINRKNQILSEVMTTNDNKVKLKIQDKILHTQEWSGGMNKAITRPKVISGGPDRLQTIADPNRGFFLPQLGDVFLGAGVYELSYTIPIPASEGGELLKKLTWKRTLKVQPGEPFEAQFKTNQKIQVTEVDGGDYSIGMKAKKKRPIIFFITDEEGKDKEQAVYTRGNICVLSEKESKNITLDARVIKPKQSGLQLLFTAVSFDKAAGEYMASLQVKMTEEKDSTVRAALEKESSVEVRFKLNIKIPGKGKKILTTTNEMVIRVKAGEPEKLVFHGDFSNDNVIEMQNRQLLEKIPVKLVDKFGNTVHLDGHDKDELVITRKLSPVNVSSEIQKRKVGVFKLTPNAGKDGPLSILDIGGFRVHLDDPCVSRMEQHKLEVTATYGAKEIDCSDLDVEVKISPSHLPHSVQPMWDQGKITRRDHEWIIPAPAGSEVNGVYFKFLDEAENEVTDLKEWTVKWPGTKERAKPFEGEATKMPPVQCREKADDILEKTIMFTGPRGEEVVAPTLSVSLTFVPYPNTPSSWKLVHPKNGQDLQDPFNITVGKPVGDFFAIQLLDAHGNPIDVKTLLDPDGGHPLMTPVLYITSNKEGATIQKNGINQDQNHLNFDFSDPKRIRPAKKFTLTGTAGDWTLTVNTFGRSSLGELAANVKTFKHKIHLTAGEPVSLKMEISGLPNETREAGEETPKYSFGGPSSQALLSSGVGSQTLSGLPSTCTIKAIEISVLDEAGNVLDKGDIAKSTSLKNKQLTLKLNNGRISSGKDKNMHDSISRNFSNKWLAFNNVKLQAGKDSGGALCADSELELSSDFKNFKVVQAPIKFSPSSAVVSVRLLPDPYTDTFRIGQRLSKIIAELRTEDRTILEGSWKQGLSIQCYTDSADSVFEPDDLFLPIPADSLDPASDGTAESVDTTLYFLPGPGALQHLGKHKIKALWKETRPSVRALVGEDAEVESNHLTFSVEHGAPHLLVRAQLHEEAVRKPVETKTVSNKKECCTVVTHLRLQLMDCRRNPCKAKLNRLYVAASLHFVGNAHAEAEEDSYEVFFPYEFFFVDDWETSSIAHRAKQELQTKLSQKLHARKKKSAEVVKIHDERKKVEKEVKKLNESIKNMLLEMSDLLGDATQILGKREDELQRRAPDGHVFTQTVYYLLTVDDCTHARSRIANSSPDLGLRIPLHYKDQADQIKRDYRGVYGLLIELIYMENSDHAAVASVQCRSALLTLIVDQRNVADEISKQYLNLDVMPLDYVTQPWKNVKQLDGGRTKLILQGDTWMTEKALVNEIRFHDLAHENLRAGAVKNLLGNVCIVKDKWEANGFIDVCRRSRQKFPDMIVASDNSKIRSNGVMRGGYQGGQHSDPLRIATRQDRRAAQDRALNDLSHQMNMKRRMANELQGFEPGHQEGDKLAQLESEEKELEDEIKTLSQQREQVVLNSKSSSSAGPDIIEDRKGTTPPELDVDARSSSGQGGAAGAQDERKHTYTFNNRGIAEIRDLKIKPEHGNQQGLYRLLFTVYCKDGDKPPSLNDVKLQREFASKRVTTDEVIVLDDDGQEMGDE